MANLEQAVEQRIAANSETVARHLYTAELLLGESRKLWKEGDIPWTRNRIEVIISTLNTVLADLRGVEELRRVQNIP